MPNHKMLLGILLLKTRLLSLGSARLAGVAATILWLGMFSLPLSGFQQVQRPAGGLSPAKPASKSTAAPSQTPAQQLGKVSEQELQFLDDATLNDVQFMGPQIGYAVGDRGVIRKTENGGNTWNYLQSPIASRWMSLCFLTDRIGWVAGGLVGTDGQTTRGSLLHTRDGGETWQVFTPVNLGQLHYVRFFDLEQGIVCGESTASGAAGIWRTADGGKTWQALNTPERVNWRCASFPTSEGGVVAGQRGRIALCGGQRVLLDQTFNLGLKGVNDVVMNARGEGWLVGDGGLVRYSSGGAAWQDPPQALPAELKTIFDFRAIAQHGNSVWIAGHPGTAIWSSRDGGQNWSMTPTPVTAPIEALTFTDAQNGWAVGAFGTILRTQDGGQTWQNLTRQSRRLAMLQFTTTAAGSSFCLTARYSGHHGYRTGVVALCSTNPSTAETRQCSEDLRLQRGIELAGGNLGTIAWALPLDRPELQHHQTQLIQRWNQATDGQLSDIVLSHIVRDLRAYRPTVVVIDLPAPEDQAGAMLRTAIHNAIRSAADPTWLISHQQYASLAPWKVQRVYEQSRIGRGGDILLESSEYLSGLNQAVRMAAGASYQVMHGNINQLPLVESFHLHEKNAAASQLHLTDLFTGIILGPGSEARRRTLPPEVDPNGAGPALARHQRNFSAYAKTHLEDEQQAGQVIAQLDDVIRKAPAKQAIFQLLELAEQYRINSQWDYYEAVLMQAIESYPNEPAVGPAAVALIQFWSSQELTQLRLKNRNTSVITRQLDTAQFQSDFQNVLQTAAEESEQPLDVVIPAFQEQEKSAAITPGTQRDRANWEITWQQRAFSAYQLLKNTAPEMAQSPEVQLPLASLLRKRGAARGVQDIYAQYLNASRQTLSGQSGQTEGQVPTLQKLAEAEFWLQTREGFAPVSFVTAHAAGQTPYLDGLLSDECWQHADEIRLKAMPGTADPSLMGAETPMMMVCYDREYLYLAASVPRHPALPSQLPEKGRRNYDADLSGFDRLQLAIDVNRDYVSSYQFEVDQRGLTYDRCWMEPKWNPEWYVACDGDAHHWRIEVAIPLRELIGDRPIQSQEVWAISFSRILPALGVQSWAQQTTAEPGRNAFGLIRFE